MAQTYSLISTTTLASETSAVTFSSIPQTYKHLIVKISARTTSPNLYNSCNMTFNANTSNYSETWLGWQGSGAVASYQGSGQSSITWVYTTGDGATTRFFGNTEIFIPDYASSSYYKSISINNAADNTTTGTNTMTLAKVGGLWQNTSPITSITFTAQSGLTFMQYSTFSLYYIENN